MYIQIVFFVKWRFNLKNCYLETRGVFESYVCNRTKKTKFKPSEFSNFQDKPEL